MASGSAAALASVELESDCPVCFEPFDPPVYQCSNGHLICHTCEPQCKICSVCREVMPKKKIRNIAFEKMLSGLSKVPGPCPQQIHGCPAMLMKNEVEAHKLECGFIQKKICSQLGLYCNKEHCTSNVNELISHFTFDHNMDGSLGTDDNNDDESPSDSKLELVSTCKKSELNKYLALQWSIPNFLKFDQKMFFIKKNVNVANKTVSIMVCIDASLKTAEMYSAVIQLLSGTGTSSNNTTASASTSTSSSNSPPGLPPFTFNQEKVLLLTTEFDQKKTSDSTSKYCTIPFSTILTYGKSSGIGKQDLFWVVHADIKNIAPGFESEPPKPSSNATKTKTKSPSTSTLSPARASKTRKLNTPASRMVRTRRSVADSSTVGSTSSARSGGMSAPQSSSIAVGHALSTRGQRGGRRVGSLISKTASTPQPRRRAVPTTVTPKKVVKKPAPAKTGSTTRTTGALGRGARSGTSRRRSAPAPRTYTVDVGSSSSSSSSDSTDSSDTSSEEESDSDN